jgi:dienelactone hydrolase
VLALHDHGGFYYFGKEKITSTERSPRALTQFIERSYGGRTYADELAQRGFVVLCPDAFYFGSQRIDVKQIPDHFTSQYPELASVETEHFIEAFNDFCWSHETVLAKYLFAAGTTWPGVLFQGDRVSVDYLLTRPEVDPERIGCMGLSIGGFRSAHLFGLDPRIRVGVVAGWMTTYTLQLFDKLRWHTWMVYVPRLIDFLDVPDVVSLNAPRPLMIINCRQDSLYPLEAMQAADRKLKAIYGKLGYEENYLCRYYDVPHSLNVAMQDDAISWLENWIGEKTAD